MELAGKSDHYSVGRGRSLCSGVVTTGNYGKRVDAMNQWHPEQNCSFQHRLMLIYRKEAVAALPLGIIAAS
ncbi:MAG: hypothetical protein BRC44_15030 [Cyanobacteria bacterium QS_4_48_99]|nr:MAG: hypothetical protein BRC44_15030 [Cyanobacteria bacterium QS_4_48_99]